MFLLVLVSPRVHRCRLLSWFSVCVPYWQEHVIFLLWSVNTVNYTGWFKNSETASHPKSELQLFPAWCDPARCWTLCLCQWRISASCLLSFPSAEMLWFPRNLIQASRPTLPLVSENARLCPFGFLASSWDDVVMWVVFWICWFKCLKHHFILSSAFRSLTLLFFWCGFPHFGICFFSLILWV